jgi:predicted glutamine amidotransferase
MCLIVSCKFKHPPLDLLEKAQAVNPDGIGLAWLSRGHAAWRKNLSLSQAAKAIKSINFPYVLHFRLASIGGVAPELCHPFPVTASAVTALTGKADAVLFHNGTWLDYQKYLGDLKLSGSASDTRALAALLARLNSTTVDRLLDALSAAQRHRFCLLTRKGPILYGRWWRVDGVDVSNLNF